MGSEDSVSLSRSEMYRQSPMQKEYTLEEAAKYILRYNNWQISAESKEYYDRLFRTAIYSGELKAKDGVRYHEYLEYPQFLSLKPKQLLHCILSGDELKRWCVKNRLMVCEVEEAHQSNDDEKVEVEAPKKRAGILLSLKNVIEILYEFMEELFNDDVFKDYDSQQKKFILSQYNLIKELGEDSLSGIRELTLRAVIVSQYWLINDMISSKTANKYNYLMPKSGNPITVTKLSKALPIHCEHRLARDTVKKHISKCLSENGM